MNEQIKIVGSESEQYLTVSSQLLDWIAPESLVIEDDDYALPKNKAKELCGAFAISSKLHKLLNEKGNNHSQFKRVFATISHAENIDVTFKIRDHEIVGVVTPNSYHLLNSTFKMKILPHLNSNKTLRQVYLSNEDIESNAVYVNDGIGEITFLNKQWLAGVTVSYSSLGRVKNPRLIPTLVPVREENSFYGLATILEDIIVVMDDVSFDSKELSTSAVDVTECVPNMVERWNQFLDKELSVFEYETLLKRYCSSGITNQEKMVIARFIQICESHDVNPGSPIDKRWKTTASSGTTVGEVIELITEIPVDFEIFAAPDSYIPSLLDKPLNLDSVANNRKAKGLDQLTWVSRDV